MVDKVWDDYFFEFRVGKLRHLEKLENKVAHFFQSAEVMLIEFVRFKILFDFIQRLPFVNVCI